MGTGPVIGSSFDIGRTVWTETMEPCPAIGSSRGVSEDRKVSPTESFTSEYTILGLVGVLGVMGTVPVGAGLVGAAGTDPFVAGETVGTGPVIGSSVDIGRTVWTETMESGPAIGSSRRVSEDRKVSPTESFTAEFTTLGFVGVMGTGPVCAAGTVPFVAGETMGTGPVTSFSGGVHKVRNVSSIEFFAANFTIVGSVPVGAVWTVSVVACGTVGIICFGAVGTVPIACDGEDIAAWKRRMASSDGI